MSFTSSIIQEVSAEVDRRLNDPATAAAVEQLLERQVDRIVDRIMDRLEPKIVDALSPQTPD